MYLGALTVHRRLKELKLYKHIITNLITKMFRDYILRISIYGGRFLKLLAPSRNLGQQIMILERQEFEMASVFVNEMFVQFQ